MRTSLPALSDEDKAAVTAAAQESAVLQRQLWAERSEASKEKVIAAGVQFNEIPDKAAFQAAMEPVYATFLAANPDLVPLVELIKNTD